MPPPCCIVSAASFTPSKMAPRSSLDLAQNETIEERYAAPRAGPGQDAARGQEAEIGHCAVKALGPLLTLLLAALFGRGHAAGDAPERVIERRVDGVALQRLEAVFPVPDFARDRRQELI